MEVTLFTFLTLSYLWLLDSHSRPYWLGLVAGLIVLVRPEGLLLVITYGLKWLVTWTTNRRAAIRSAGLFLLPFVAIASPLFVFNWLYGNGPLPQTVSAKYLQYGIPWTLPKSIRYLVGVIKYFVWGPLLLLAPYAAVPIFRAGRTRNRRLVYPLAWMVGLVGLYAVALPHLYHNGRYIIPLIPLVVILGAEGLQWVITALGRWRLFWPLYKLAVVAVVVALWINGASIYSLQVELLSESHLAIAEWISERTPVDAVIATHDVGLLGYYGGRELLDLAGLITPEAVPILDDQQALAQLCRRNGVTHLVVFTGYYPTLLQELNARLVFSPDSERLRAMALEPFEVYEVQ
jgi:arabinofuranosyltransferase